MLVLTAGGRLSPVRRFIIMIMTISAKVTSVFPTDMRLYFGYKVGRMFLLEFIIL